MKITILADNNTLIDRYFKGEPALSFLLEENGRKILFDAGYSDVFIENAGVLNENLMELDNIVISHGHMDHTWGLDPLIRKYAVNGFEQIFAKKRPEFIAHPLIFNQKYFDGLPIGINVSESLVRSVFDVKLSKEPVNLSENLIFLGEIPRKFDFEAKVPIGQYEKDGKLYSDYLHDDSALVYKSPKGLVIITGCSHAGICNIVEYAKEVTKINKVVSIIGGLHLLNPGREVMKGIKPYLKALDLDRIYPCHCTDLNSKIELAKTATVCECGSGLILDF